jgi:hypothetical protein
MSTSVLQVRLRATFGPALNEKRLSLRFSSLVFEVVQLQSSYGTTCVCQQVALWLSLSKLGRSCQKRGFAASCVMTFWRANQIEVDGPSERRRLFHIVCAGCWRKTGIRTIVRASPHVETT